MNLKSLWVHSLNLNDSLLLFWNTSNIISNALLNWAYKHIEHMLISACENWIHLHGRKSEHFYLVKLDTGLALNNICLMSKYLRMLFLSVCGLWRREGRYFPPFHHSHFKGTFLWTWSSVIYTIWTDIVTLSQFSSIRLYGFKKKWFWKNYLYYEVSDKEMSTWLAPNNIESDLM